MTGREVIELTGCIDDFLDARITEFNDVAGIHVDQVIMLHAAKCLFELGDVLSKLVLDHQAAIQEEFNGIVQGSPADPVVFILHEDIEGFYIKVTVSRVDLVQNGISLGGFTMAFFLQVFGENLFDRFFRLLLGHT